MTALLTVEDLHVTFDTEHGSVRAVDGVSFVVERGASLGVVGESGCGKSATALALMGLLDDVGAARVSGSVVLTPADGAETEMVGASRSVLRRIRGPVAAMVFQDPLSALHPLKRVGDQIAEALRAHGGSSRADARNRAIELLALVGIPDPRRRAEAYPHEMSGGMAQRAMIAMALCHDPALLIADEPTTALDVTVQAQILDLLARLRAELGMALLLISHDAGVVASVVDEVCVMYAGRVVEQAPVIDLFGAPGHPYTWGLLGSVPRLDRPRGVALTPIPGRPPAITGPRAGCAFAPRCAFARPSHHHIDPALEPEGAPHRVACLLPAPARAAAWGALRSGAEPGAARTAAGIDTLPEPEVVG